MNRRLLFAQLAVLALFAVTCWALYRHVDVRLADQSGIRMVMPAQAGEWTGTQLLFCHDESCAWSGASDQAAPDGSCPKCSATLFPMAKVEKDLLPADTQFLKYEYRRPGAPPMMVSIVLSGNERNSIHRPQRCLKAQGNTITKTQVERLPIPGREDIRVMLLQTLYQNPAFIRDGKVPSAQFAYFFVGQNRDTPYHIARMFWLAWDRIVHGVAHRWAYIMINSSTGVTPDTFLSDLRQFAPDWYPQVLGP